MFFLKPLERRTLHKVKRLPGSLLLHKQVNALLGLAKGEPLRLVALKLSEPEDRVLRWVKNYEQHRARRRRHVTREDRSLTDLEIDRKAKSLMPSLQDLLNTSRQAPSAIGADLDDDPADLF